MGYTKALSFGKYPNSGNGSFLSAMLISKHVVPFCFLLSSCLKLDAGTFPLLPLFVTVLKKKLATQALFF